MFYSKLSASLVLLTLVVVSVSSAQDACAGSPEPVSFTDNFTVHPGSNPAWLQNDPSVTCYARVAGTVGGNIFTILANENRADYIELKQFTLAKTVWSVSLDFRFESIDMAGDGLFLHFLHQRNCKIVDKNIVELDTHKNAVDPHDGGNGDTGAVIGTGGGIALLGYSPSQGEVNSCYYNFADNHLAWTNQNIHHTDFTASGAGAWKNIRVDFLNGRYRVYLNNSKVLDHTLTVDYDDTIFRLVARNGADTYRVKVKNFSISTEHTPSCPRLCPRLPEQHGN